MATASNDAVNPNLVKSNCLMFDDMTKRYDAVLIPLSGLSKWKDKDDTVT